MVIDKEEDIIISRRLEMHVLIKENQINKSEHFRFPLKTIKKDFATK